MSPSFFALTALALLAVTCEATTFNVNVTVFENSNCGNKQPSSSFVIPNNNCHTFHLPNTTITDSLKIYCQGSSTSAYWMLSYWYGAGCGGSPVLTNVTNTKGSRCFNPGTPPHTFTIDCTAGGTNGAAVASPGHGLFTAISVLVALVVTRFAFDIGTR